MMMNRRSYIAGSSAFLLGPTLSQLAAAEDHRPSQAEAAAMRKTAEDFMRDKKIPGLSIAIARYEHLVYEGAFGVANTITKQKVHKDSLFRIASVSKPITAVAIFSLIEHGRLKLSDRVFGTGGVLEAYYAASPNSNWLTEITIEHLLTHTAGGWTNDGNDPMFKTPSLAHDALIASTIRQNNLQHRPGTHYAYSNFGYCLLGRVIEKITHQPYETFVRQAILRPAGITAMRIGKGHGPLPGEVSYSSLGSTRAFDLNIERMDSHGGWIASAEDLVRFARMVDGFSSPSLLKSSTIALMVTPSHANKGYAHGWSINAAGNWWHTGVLPGTTSIMVRTKSRFCWAALINVGGPQAKLDGALDDFCWSMVRKVRSWDA